MNLTNGINDLITSKECFNWCVVQKVTGYNNVETIYILFVAGALIMLIIYEMLEESENHNKYAPQFIFYAKTLLYIFFFAYFIILKLRFYYYFN